MSGKFTYLTCCVHIPQEDVEDLQAMVEARHDVSYRTFAKHCAWKPWALELGYQVGPGNELHLQADWHVNYYRSTFKGQPCYYANHSGIEHIFVQQAAPSAIRRPW